MNDSSKPENVQRALDKIAVDAHACLTCLAKQGQPCTTAYWNNPCRPHANRWAGIQEAFQLGATYGREKAMASV